MLSDLLFQNTFISCFGETGWQGVRWLFSGQWRWCGSSLLLLQFYTSSSYAALKQIRSFATNISSILIKKQNQKIPQKTPTPHTRIKGFECLVCQFKWNTQTTLKFVNLSFSNYQNMFLPKWYVLWFEWMTHK